MASTRKRRKPAPRQLEKKTLPQLRRKLWQVMSKALGDRWRNEDGSTDCYTCDRNIPKGGKVDRGHCWPKRIYKGLYFDARTIRAQCFRCNGPGQGEQYIFVNKLGKEYHPKEFAAILKKKDKDWPTDKGWYIRQIKRWQSGSS